MSHKLDLVEDDVPVRIRPLLYQPKFMTGRVLEFGPEVTAMWRRPNDLLGLMGETFLAVNKDGHALIMDVIKRRGNWLQVTPVYYPTGLVYVVCHLLVRRKEGGS